MSKLMVRIACGLLILLVAVGGLAGCSGGGDESSEPDYAGPIVEGLLQSLNDGDYETHIAYYAPEVRSAVVEGDFIASCQVIKDTIGDYIDKEYQDTTVENVYIVVHYIARYTDEPDDVEVTVYFREVDGETYVFGCGLVSPKLIAASQQ